MKLSPFAALCILLAAPARAQPESEPPATPPLSGPEVVEQRIEGVEAGFSSMTASRGAGEPVPMPVFRRAIRELAGPAALEGARLTDRQTQRLRTIQRKHGRAVAAHRRLHEAEIAELRRAIGPLPDRWQRDDLSAQQRAAMMRLQEIRSRAPRPQTVQARVWAELTQPQRAQVQLRIDEHRATIAEQREAARTRRLAERLAARAETERGEPARQRPDASERAPADLPPELRDTLESLPAPASRRLSRLAPERLERVLRRLSRLGPEERAQELRRLQRPRARPQAPRAERDHRRPPPPMERVNIPDPRN